MLNFTNLSVVSSSSGYQLAVAVGSEPRLARSIADTTPDLLGARCGAEPLPITPPSPAANQGRPPPAQKSKVTLTVLAKIGGGMQSSPPP